VTRLYLRDSLPTDMTGGEETRRGADSMRTEQIGKVFLVVGQDVRECLICEGVFTQRAASEHAKVICHPVSS